MIANETFLEAVKQGSLDKIQAMLEEQPDLVNAKDAKGISATLWASYRGHKEIAAFLVSKGANLNIFEAATVGSADQVQQYLKKDPSLALAFAPDGFTALGLASFFGNADVVRLLIKAGADVNASDANGTTPMHVLAAGVPPNLPPPPKSVSGIGLQDIHLQTARLLLSRGANLQARIAWGWTPVETAEKSDTTYMANLLREHEAKGGV